MMPRLLTIKEAANELGVPPGSVRTAAKRHRLLVRMGRALRIDPETLPELIKLCREKPQERDSTNASTAYGSSATGSDPCQRALATAAKLKEGSRDTSRNETAQPGRVIPLK